MILLDDLEIYKLANDIGNEAWTIVSDWDYFNKDTLGKQFTRAADSISLNIAEGYGRYHYKENKNFCYYSRGSAYETRNCLSKGLERKLVTMEQNLHISNKLELFLKKLNAYINVVGRFERKFQSPDS